MKQLVIVIILVTTAPLTVISQSLTGLQGLMVTPSAEMHPNGTIAIGSSYFDHHNLAYTDYQYNGLAGFASLTFLPFLELSFRYTSELRPITYENNNFPDRMPSIRVRAVKERKILPSLLIGLHDITSVSTGINSYFGASYLVTTKNILLNQINIQFNSGYGFSFLQAQHHELKGYFGGLAFHHRRISNLTLMVEYDSRDINAGIKYLLWNHLQLTAVAREMRYLEGGISFRTTMK